MSVDEKLDLIIDNMAEMKKDVSDLKTKVSNLESDVEILKRAAAVMENDVALKVNLMLENHTDILNNIHAAKKVDERVNVLEFDMKVVKIELNSLQKLVA